MAIIKHIAIKNSNYDAATNYLTMQHDELTMEEIVDEDGRPVPREEYLLDGINCDPYTFAMECEATNAAFHKNQNKSDVKAHHYIISFDPRDRDENNLTLQSAQTLCVDFAKKNFPGHQALVCAHPDGHNSAGNIHVHIVINSVRKRDVDEEEKRKMSFTAERGSDYLAGYKHHVTKPFLEYLKQETMTMCQENSLYQVDLLSPAKVRITDREYWAKRKGQAKLDAENEEKIRNGIPAEEIKIKEYKTDKEFLQDAIKATLESITPGYSIPDNAKPGVGYISSVEDLYKSFCDKLFTDYGITVHESRGKIGYILPDHIKPIRGRALGTDFEKEHIIEILSEKAPKAKTEPTRYASSGIRLLTDLETCLKAQQNQYYARKVKITNLQQMAKTMDFIFANGIDTVDELDSLLAATKADVNDRHATLKSTEAELKQTNLLIKYTGQYLANKDTYRRYMKSENKADFREAHRAEITLYEAARKYLKEAGYLQKQNKAHAATEQTPAKSNTGTSGSSGTGNLPYIPNIKQLKAHKEDLTARKNTLYEDYSYSRAKYRELQTVHQNVHSILDMGRDDDTRHNRDHMRGETIPSI